MFFLLFRRRFLVPLGDFGGGAGGLTIKLGGGAGGPGGRGRDVVGFSVGFVISEPPDGGAGGPGGRVGFGLFDGLGLGRRVGLVITPPGGGAGGPGGRVGFGLFDGLGLGRTVGLVIIPPVGGAGGPGGFVEVEVLWWWRLWRRWRWWGFVVREDNFITFSSGLEEGREGDRGVCKYEGGGRWGLIWNSLSESDDKVSGHITGLVVTWDARSPVSTNQSSAVTPGDLSADWSPGHGWGWDW